MQINKNTMITMKKKIDILKIFLKYYKEQKGYEYNNNNNTKKEENAE